MKHGRCEDCKFWDNSTTVETLKNSGICRFSPPVADDRTGHARWPFTEDTDWCASFAPAPLPLTAD